MGERALPKLRERLESIRERIRLPRLRGEMGEESRDARCEGIRL